MEGGVGGWTGQRRRGGELVITCAPIMCVSMWGEGREEDGNGHGGGQPGAPCLSEVARCLSRLRDPTAPRSGVVGGASLAAGGPPPWGAAAPRRGPPRARKASAGLRGRQETQSPAPVPRDAQRDARRRGPAQPRTGSDERMMDEAATILGPGRPIDTTVSLDQVMSLDAASPHKPHGRGDPSAWLLSLQARHTDHTVWATISVNSPNKNNSRVAHHAWDARAPSPSAPCRIPPHTLIK